MVAPVLKSFQAEVRPKAKGLSAKCTQMPGALDCRCWQLLAALVLPHCKPRPTPPNFLFQGCHGKSGFCSMGVSSLVPRDLLCPCYAHRLLMLPHIRPVTLNKHQCTFQARLPILEIRGLCQGPGLPWTFCPALCSKAASQIDPKCSSPLGMSLLVHDQCCKLSLVYSPSCHPSWPLCLDSSSPPSASPSSCLPGALWRAEPLHSPCCLAVAGSLRMPHSSGRTSGEI
jgi:hypothetical protein